MKLIKLDHETTARCIAAGKRQQQELVANVYPQSTALSSHGIENDPEALAEAKMAECILAVSFGLPVDPIFRGPPLRPWDVKLPCGRRADVKSTKTSGHYLIWPLKKNGIYLSKDFDILVLVKNDWNCGFPCGFMTKGDFFARKSIAGPGHKLTEGTWHVDQALLEPIELLLIEKLEAMRRKLNEQLVALENEINPPFLWLADEMCGLREAA